MRRSLRVRTAAVAVVLALVSVVGGVLARPAPASAADGVCVDNPFGDRSIYLRGGFSSWNALPEYEMVYDCNRFELLLELSGTSSFKVADATWSADADFGGGAAGSELTAGEPLPLAIHGPNLTFAFDGTQQVVLDVSASAQTPTLTITQCPAPPLEDALLALSGSLNGGRPAPTDYFVYACDAYYLNVDVEGTQEFTITDPLGTGATTFGAPDAENDVVTADEPFPLVSGEDVGEVQPLTFDFTGEHTLRVGFEGDDARPVLTIGERTFVNPGIPLPVTDPVLRGVRFDSRDTTFKAPFGAQPTGTPVEFAIQAPAGLDSATLVVETRVLEGNQEVLEYRDPVRIPMTREPAADVERWTASHTFGTASVSGYYVELVNGERTYVYENNADTIYWTLERGSGGVGRVDFLPEDRAEIRRYRHTAYDPDFTVPDWAADAVYYYVFPERFRNGDTANDPRPDEDTYLDGPVEVHEDWLDTPWVPGESDGSTTDDDQYNNDFFGGDLAGIIEKLDYLKDLGVNTLYLNPIFEAGSNHKYDTADYLNVDDGFGTNEDVSRLTEQAEERGMRVILDTSLNHTGSDSVYFDRYSNFDALGAFEGETISPGSPYADWYRFFPEETEPDRQYAGWVGVSTLPELTESDSFKDFAFGAPDSVMSTWQDRGVDGWRMDVAPWVSDQFWREWRAAVKAKDPEALTVAETWFDSSKYFLGDTFDTTMNYIFRNAVLDYADGRDAGEAYQNIELMREAYPPQAFHALMNLLSTHDSARALHQFGYTGEGTPPEQVAEAKQRLRLAVLFQMTFPGAPTVFYGDEVGVTGGEDPFNRATYPWADQGGEPDTELLDDVTRLIALRNEHDVLRRGSLGAPLHLDEHLVVLLREHEGARAVTAYNNDTEAHEVTVEIPAGDGDQTFTDALTGAVATPVDGSLTITVPPLGGTVLLSGEAPAPSIEALRADLAAAQESGEVTGPVSRRLTQDLDRAARHHERGRLDAAVRQLGRFVDHLESPGRYSTVSPEALERLRGQAEALVAVWSPE
ncbi:glycoside hydrolase family 13 protein [Cellulomonas sp. 179-A 4D5 NHS]|uniref:glycoside hydrolase family 13 protein n=1 Tax=Cellulomonas sp. 179-A 4D5 NHS TaxID=3142378 RepID=UPI0039A1AB47